MKANEFVKKYSFDHAKDVYNGRITNYDSVDLDELKIIVESHDYIECLGGYQFVKENLPLGYFGDGDYKDLIQKSLEDMEICK